MSHVFKKGDRIKLSEERSSLRPHLSGAIGTIQSKKGSSFYILLDDEDLRPGGKFFPGCVGDEGNRNCWKAHIDVLEPIEEEKISIGTVFAFKTITPVIPVS